jgi:hypothetical protein
MPPAAETRGSPGRRLVVEACLALVAMRVALRCVAFARLQRFTARLRSAGAARPADPPSVVAAVDAAARRVARRHGCLAKALAAQLLLARRGRASTIRFGVRHGPAGEFAAHAWLECDGAVLVGADELETYAPLRASGDRAP